MVEYDKNLRKQLFPVITLLLIVLVIIGVSYAFYIFNTRGEKSINIRGKGSLSLELDDDASSGISLLNTVPTSDADGLNTTPYNFSIVNNGNTTIKYSISLVDSDIESGKERIADTNIKYSISKNDSTEQVNVLSSRKIESDTIISPGTTNNYSLKIWLNSNATTDVSNQVFKTKVVVDAIQYEQ